MNENLLIIGAGGHGKVVADIALKMKKWKRISFLDDDPKIKIKIGLDIIGSTNDAFKMLANNDIFVAIGNNFIREKVQETLQAEGATIATLIHPCTVIGEEVDLGVGTVVMAGVVINCCTSVGKGCIINTSSTIDHDNQIGDYVHISPGAHLAGNARVGRTTWIGLGSLISNSIFITNSCKVGAGAVVINDITQSGTYVGVPARKI